MFTDIIIIIILIILILIIIVILIIIIIILIIVDNSCHFLNSNALEGQTTSTPVYL